MCVCVQGRAVISEGHVSVASTACEHEECCVLALPAERHQECVWMEPRHGEWVYCVCVFAVLLLFHSVVLFLHLNIPVNNQVQCQSPAERQQVLTHLESHLADFLSDSKESTLFTPGDRQELEEDVQQAQQHCQDLLLNMEAGEMTAANKPHAHPLRSRKFI